MSAPALELGKLYRLENGRLVEAGSIPAEMREGEAAVMQVEELEKAAAASLDARMGAHSADEVMARQLFAQRR